MLMKAFYKHERNELRFLFLFVFFFFKNDLLGETTKNVQYKVNSLTLNCSEPIPPKIITSQLVLPFLSVAFLDTFKQLYF